VVIGDVRSWLLVGDLCVDNSVYIATLFVNMIEAKNFFMKKFSCSRSSDSPGTDHSRQ